MTQADPAGDAAAARRGRGGSVRIAVASRDGVTVNERLHRAADLLIFDCDRDTATFRERRLRAPLRGDRARDFSARAAEVADCAGLIALGLNGAARSECAAHGIMTLETRSDVDHAVRTLARHLLARATEERTA